MSSMQLGKRMAFLQHQLKGNNCNPNRHLMQHMYCPCVFALLFATEEKALWMWHLEFPEMKAEVVVVTLLRVPIPCPKNRL